MKKQCFRTFINLFLFILFYHPSSAQTCYAIYKNQGDRYKALAASQTDSQQRNYNYNLARQQYLNARGCTSLTNAQRIMLDQLLAEVNNKIASPKVITTIRRNTR